MQTEEEGQSQSWDSATMAVLLSGGKPTAGVGLGFGAASGAEPLRDRSAGGSPGALSMG